MEKYFLFLVSHHWLLLSLLTSNFFNNFDIFLFNMFTLIIISSHNHFFIFLSIFFIIINPKLSHSIITVWTTTNLSLSLSVNELTNISQMNYINSIFLIEIIIPLYFAFISYWTIFICSYFKPFSLFLIKHKSIIRIIIFIWKNFDDEYPKIK